MSETDLIERAHEADDCMVVMGALDQARTVRDLLARLAAVEAERDHLRRRLDAGDLTRLGRALRAEARVEALESFVVAVSPFVRDVLDKPFPWEEGGRVVVWMQRWKYDEAVAARAVLSAVADTHERVTHGRHCSCTPCQREDWTQPHLQHCGMHGDACPDLVADTQQEQPHD